MASFAKASRAPLSHGHVVRRTRCLIQQCSFILVSGRGAIWTARSSEFVPSPASEDRAPPDAIDRVFRGVNDVQHATLSLTRGR